MVDTVGGNPPTRTPLSLNAELNLRMNAMLEAGRSPGLYILVVRQSMQTCHAGCAAYPYFLTCLGLVRQRSGDIGALYSSKGIPPLQHSLHSS